jgi:hypothetical protein|tara:strand:- start:265 stop:438 length:174 start_codon:yes stop_codon:yes gene_type:complete
MNKTAYSSLYNTYVRINSATLSVGNKWLYWVTLPKQDGDYKERTILMNETELTNFSL